MKLRTEPHRYVQVLLKLTFLCHIECLQITLGHIQLLF